MLLKHSLFGLSLLACPLLLGLSGCIAAAPLAQMAVSQKAPAKPPCVAGPNCPADMAAGSFGDMSRGITDSFHKLTGGTPDPQAAAVGAPAK
jgi:hypothetical protein